MRGKIAWIVGTFLTVFSFLVVSCSSTPAVAPTTAAPKPTVAGAAPTTAAPSAASPTVARPAASPAAQTQAPKYGGTLTAITPIDPTNFDSGTKNQGQSLVAGIVYEQYMGQDWMKGPAGGGPPDYFIQGVASVEDLYAPQIAESWKYPAPGTWVLQIRKGIRWQKVDSDAGRLMGGREVTADDVVSSLKRLLTVPTAWAAVSQPAMFKNTTVEKTGDREVTIKTTADLLTTFFWIVQGGGYNDLYPPEVVAKYGDVADWHNTVGTGPYMLTDYTKGSSLTYTKNPDYWGTDPAGPGKGNKLPYIDTFKQLIIPDISTQLAAFRTAKADLPGTVSKEDAQTLLKDNPQIVNYRYLMGLGNQGPFGIAMPTAKQDLPYKDKRVRQAMMLATDFNGLSQSLYGGDAEIDEYPVNKQVKSLFTPISELPQASQDLFKYNPNKAKQLLADAGYPNGFKASIAVQNDPALLDELSVYKQMWAKVGIDLTINPMENAAFTAMNQARTNPELIYRGLVAVIPMALYLSPYRGSSSNNPSFIDDPFGTVPEIEAVNDTINKNVFIDWSKVNTAYKSLKPVLIDGSYIIPRPQPYQYNMWWPWVKNWYGAYGTGDGFIKYAWIDQDLKKSMGR